MADPFQARVLDEIRRIFATELERSETVELGHALLGDLHVDSLDAVVLAVGLENAFRLKLDDEDTAGVVTVGDLVERVALRAKAAS
jgi:acyl carrier protein